MTTTFKQYLERTTSMVPPAAKAPPPPQSPYFGRGQVMPKVANIMQMGPDYRARMSASNTSAQDIEVQARIISIAFNRCQHDFADSSTNDVNRILYTLDELAKEMRLSYEELTDLQEYGILKIADKIGFSPQILPTSYKLGRGLLQQDQITPFKKGQIQLSKTILQFRIKQGYYFHKEILDAKMEEVNQLGMDIPMVQRAIDLAAQQVDTAIMYAGQRRLSDPATQNAFM